MIDQHFYLLFSEAVACLDRDMYVAEWSTSSVFAEDSDLIENAAVCCGIWDAAHITIKEIRRHTGLSQAAFATRYVIPRRTIEDWETGKRTPPDYVRLMLIRLSGAIDLPIQQS